MNYEKDFDGLTAAVTGAGLGIGLTTVLMLKERGVTVIGLDLKEGDMSSVAKWILCDIGDSKSVTSAFAQFPTLDILVNNAGVSVVGSVETSTDEEWSRVLNVNVVGLVRTSRAALPLLRKSNHAAIVNTCSVAATAGIPKRAIYSETKGAVLSLTLATANDHLADGVRVNCVNPGTADTPWVQRLLS